MARILIVDDHPVIRRLLTVTLESDYELIEAEDGVGALDAIRRHQPQLVLLDVMMPGELDGLQVLDAIRANPLTQDILVAMVSARGQDADRDTARERGADAYFVKPFSPLHMRDWVRSVLPPSFGPDVP